ncbi:hypothetical protein IT570_04395 [Candidatus Sumerlaeota bacterium]|nr:hypothetical protein [Candidatus Sumerlaeota bacterium]
MKKMLKLAMVCAAVSLAVACAEVDRGSAQASASAPEAAKVEVLSIPYNAALPKYVVAVEPFEYGAAGVTSGAAEGSNIYNQPGAQVGPGVSAQLTTALTRAGNVSVVELEGLTKGPNGTYTTNLQEGEVGPFIVRGIVTEFNETADLSGKKRGGSAGALGTGLGIIGGATGSSTLSATGGVTAAANPTVENEKVKRSGMVGLDLKLIDGRTGRIVRGYNASGSFTTVAAKSNMKVFGVGGEDTEFAASALGQATRQAMNTAVKETVDALSVVTK